MAKFFLIPFIFFSITACSQTVPAKDTVKQVSSHVVTDTAYFGAGCFWCVEAIFESINGVSEVISGYTGGHVKDPTYEMVCQGNTGHAETVMIRYDANVVKYDSLLSAFFGSHNPSLKDQQGPDKGSQYRSAIFYRNDAEKSVAKAYIKKLLSEKAFKVIATEVAPLSIFYPAEIYHQDYEKNNPYNPYVERVSKPRINSFQKKYPYLLKPQR
jgi:peptide-methionine (S)-S-oxide reductase